MPLQVYFDGACPMCSREIRHYQALAAQADFEWIDIHTQAERLAAVGLPVETALRVFHVRDANGQWLRGIHGFMAVWQRLPGYRYLAKVIAVLRLQGLLDRVYHRFAAWRFGRQCDSGTCRKADES